ncbi:lipid-A-disaccharide synthase [Brevirhabdus pacifica]|uniref:Lipid-A-disaccharide synthase n=1 Tax=Brevirhabdus pacifica TaxID=1267768 RepID=A0A1U7DFG8_9RHOB|nr:lipid-A-disaccharide synthase [Brevirhabdus pacifica]APX88706.1 lipid-A-disaccharide synthase [Brevirhabdus pacifica]OWU79969.1 lipid-A-disaccharide synthase [Loktanella sp. 22II-4b]PJJ86781.1 lipid-A-disaccharide synthase [Brevirhabdus pacifica]
MRYFLIAGEPSGDRLGASLMAGLRALDPDASFAGVGGALMEDAGLTSLFPMEELSVMGIAEVLPKYRQLKRRIGQTAREILQDPPDVLITIDSPDFCLRVARLVRAESRIRTVHYVAPTVWAWRPGRATKMAPLIDQVLALFPFEPPYMEAAGMRCDFVGHPVVAEPRVSADERQAMRDGLGVADGAPLIVLLPGSRRGEISRLLPVFGAALEKVLSRHPDARVVLPAGRQVAGMVAEACADWKVRPIILDPRGMEPDAAEARKRAALAAADVALAASGTVSLELAAADTPMVIAYDMNWLSRRIMLPMLRTDTVTLVNLVAESRTIPEFLADDCRPGPIAEALVNLMDDPAARDGQQGAMALTMERLGRGGEDPGLRAARAVLDGLRERRSGGA